MSSSDDELKSGSNTNGTKEESSVTKTSAPKSEKENKSEEPEQAEILDNLPPEARKIIEMAISSQSFIGRMPNPILNKITPEHIDKILDQSAKEEEHDFTLTKTNRNYNLIYFIIIVGLIVFLIVYLADRNLELLKSLAEKAMYLLAGFAGGYGLKAYKDRDSD